MLRFTATTISTQGDGSFELKSCASIKSKWLSLCTQNPGILVGRSSRDSEVGPLQALIDELEFNEIAATQ
jgi:hypothetical protein